MIGRLVIKPLDALPGPLRYVLGHLLLGVPLALAIALFFSLGFDNPFGTNFVYSLCIGLICQLVIDLGRRGAARALGRGQWPGWPVTLLIVAAAVPLGIYGGYALAGWLLDRAIPAPGLANWRTLFIVVTVSLVASLGFTLAGWSRGRLAAADAQAQRAQRAAAENQLKLLESQLEPHMLFNTLANLRVLITLDPPRAQAMLDRLIGFLRATLTASRAGMHPLSAEIDRLADYLALMQVRMGSRLHFHFDVPDELRALPVPPLLLQPLVENAITHGLEPKLEGGRIDVVACRDADTLTLTVRDSGIGLAPGARTQGTRFGTTQVRERLAALYGPRAEFVLAAASAGGTEARITIPLETPR